ncbi:MAG: cobalamin-binding protein [Nitrospiraceae bacterium]|nr:cobalamin-binding protein [Nitrospiraceae bacterium]
MRRGIQTLAYITLFLAGFCGQAFSFPEKVLDDRKKEIEMPSRPERIVSLAPTNTELLFALGLDKEIVGVTQFCDYPAAAKAKEKIGGFANIDADRIVSLKPDLVLAFGTIQLPVVAELEKRGIRVFWIYPHTVNDILRSFERIGKLTGRIDEAKRLRQGVEKEIGALQEATGQTKDEKRLTVLRVMSFNTPATIGAESFQTDIFSLAGGRNAFPAAGKDYFELSSDELAAGNPDVVLICGDDDAGLKQRIKESPLYGKLPAVQKGRVLVLPCDLTCKPGPRVGEMIRRLAEYLHPEIGYHRISN